MSLEKRRKLKVFRSLGIMSVIFSIMGSALPLSAAPAQGPAAEEPIPNVPGNLLANPSMELPYFKQCCQPDLSRYFPNTPIDEVQVPNGWSGWWRDAALPLYPPRCDYQGAAPDCKAFHRPEFRDAAAGGGGFAAYANRIHSGRNAEKYFTFYSIHEAGMYQRVTNGIRPGQRLHFSIYLQAWSTHEAENLVSSGQQTMNLRVGIDPFGGTDPFSANIVWSPFGDSYDVYKQFSVEAVAQSNAVTVFTYSRPIYPLQHNDGYLDDGALVVVGTAAAPAPAPAAGAGSSNPSTLTGPFPGTTVDKNGNVLYVVQAKDTAWSISRKFNTTVAALTLLNRGSVADITKLRIGRTIIVGKVKK
jgi:hypothetical protein